MLSQVERLAQIIFRQALSNSQPLRENVYHPHYADTLTEDSFHLFYRCDSREVFLVLESELNGRDLIVGASGEIRDRLVLDFATFAEGRPEQMPGEYFAIFF